MRQKKKNSIAKIIKKTRQIRFFIYLALFICSLFVVKYTYKKARFYYAMYLMKERAHLLTNTTFEKNRIRRIISDYNDATFGIDISHYQDFMVFDSLSLMHGSIPIEFVVMRATMGKDGIDRKFNRYWQQLENQDFIRGAYHYYRPWESPELQAKLFLDQIELKKGDLRPVLDIEKIAKNQSKESLVADLQIWLNLVEEEYQTKPIIYTYYHFYKENLENQFDDYPLWIANYNDVAEPITDVDWQFWQFTENGILPGVPHKVDINIFNGGRWQLLKYTLD